ncbi:MAG: hypothetical protein LBU98_05910, partial [Alistipes sp.]|nr:hypothetical protein [Alistipes sp.]
VFRLFHACEESVFYQHAHAGAFARWRFDHYARVSAFAKRLFNYYVRVSAFAERRFNYRAHVSQITVGGNRHAEAMRARGQFDTVFTFTPRFAVFIEVFHYLYGVKSVKEL